jgi:ABC-2 type transport system ATP-binding protein
MSIVTLKRINKVIGGRHVLLDVDLEIPRGEVFGLIGPDGAGKTTLFNIMMGLLTPTSGEVLLLDQPPIKVRREVSYLTQQFSCYPDLTVRENAMYAGTIRGIEGAELDSRVDKYLSALELKRFADRRARNLSGGMKQKLALVCALTSQPQILLLDEPGTGVDPVSRREFWDLLMELGEGITTVISTPYMDEAERCHRVGLIHHGALIDVGTTQELKGRVGESALEAVFLHHLVAAGSSEPPVPQFISTIEKHIGIGIEAKNLTKNFGSFCAVRDLSLSIPYGSIFGLLGANGAGKTTAIKMLCGLMQCTTGDIRVNGSSSVSSEQTRQRIGYMSQKFTLYDDLTIKENLEFYAGIYGVPANVRRNRISEVLEFAQLQAYADTLTGELPAGWKQRVALGASIMHNPQILFLDEPTSGMDPLARAATWDLIRELARRGVAVLVTTHYMDEAEHCDEVGFMADGELLVSGTPAAIKSGLPGTLYEVLTDLPVKAAQILKSSLADWKVALFANSLHIALQSGDPPIERICEQLVAANIQVQDSRAIPYSLEDAFIQLVCARSVPAHV